MDQIIKQIKQELKPLRKQLNLRCKHSNLPKQEVLEYIKPFGLNTNKHNLTVKISLQKAEKSISLNYSFICMRKFCELNNSYSFFDESIKEYPGIPKEDVKKIKELYQFDVVEGIIQNKIPLETQANVIVEVVSKNISNIIEHVRNQNQPKEVQ